MRDRRQLVPLAEPDERWGFGSGKAHKTTGGAAEIIADEKSLGELRQPLALTQERMA